MTKVVFQSISYWLTDDFMLDCQKVNILPWLLEFENGQRTSKPITKEEMAVRHSDRVAGWGHSVTKSVSVFRASLNADKQFRFANVYRSALEAGLEVVSPYFTARTGAQGKVRLPATASFMLAIHDQAKDGSPQLHAHIGISDRVTVPGLNKTYATHKVELYQLRELFDAAVTHSLAHALSTHWGVRVSKVQSVLELPDVPKELCRLSSNRKQQIEDYLKRHQVKSTPLSRSYAALATRHENAKESIGHQLFQEALKRHGFQGESLIRASKQTAVRHEQAVVHVGRTITKLVKDQHQFTKQELLTESIKTASPLISLKHLERAAEECLRNSHQLGIGTSRNHKQQVIYVPRQPHATWRSIARRIEFLIMERQKGRPEGTQHSGSQAQAKPSASASREQHDSPKWKNTVKRVLCAYRVIGALGQKGIHFVKHAVDLYQEWSKPVWHVNGRGHRNMPGSVAAMVRDLTPLSRKDAHRVALRAMWKLNGTFQQKLRYGEAVYQRARRAKYRIPRKCLIVVRDMQAAHPRDAQILFQKARKAKIIFVDRELSRHQLLQAAKEMQPGERRKYEAQERSR